MKNGRNKSWENFFSAHIALRRVRRMPLTFTVKDQSVMEHTGGAAMLASVFLEYLDVKNEGSLDGAWLLPMVLFHDHAEAWTGDLDYNVKNYDSELEASWDRVEDELRYDALGETANYVCRREVNDRHYCFMVKLCDYADLALYLISEWDMGNRSEGIKSALSKCVFLMTKYVEPFDCLKEEDSPLSVLIQMVKRRSMTEENSLLLDGNLKHAELEIFGSVLEHMTEEERERLGISDVQEFRKEHGFDPEGYYFLLRGKFWNRFRKSKDEKLNNLEEVSRDVSQLVRSKSEGYGYSWRKRGDVTAFNNLARKFDRIENLMMSVSGDASPGLIAARDGEPFIDTLVDMAAYSLMWLSKLSLEHPERYEEWKRKNNIEADADDR